MKRRRRGRQIFVLTPEEKKVVACVLGALLLGLGTQRYRAAHPRPPVAPTAEEQRAARLAQRTAEARARSARTAKAARLTPAPSNPDLGDDD